MKPTSPVRAHGDFSAPHKYKWAAKDLQAFEEIPMKDRAPNRQADKRKFGENRNYVVNRTKQITK